MISAVNTVISAVGSCLVAILALLPSSPFTWDLSQSNDFIKAICWVFPVASAIDHLTTYVAAVAVYYAIRVVLRWVKAVGS